LLLVTVVACKGGADRPSTEVCQKALDHLAAVAETGENKIPRDKYLAENKGMVKTCTDTFSKAKVECLMTMTDISGSEWARCK
jgi:hypothetical protein